MWTKIKQKVAAGWKAVKAFIGIAVVFAAVGSCTGVATAADDNRCDCDAVRGVKQTDCTCYPCKCPPLLANGVKPAGCGADVTFQFDEVVYDEIDGKTRAVLEIRSAKGGKKIKVQPGDVLSVNGKPVSAEEFRKWSSDHVNAVVSLIFGDEGHAFIDVSGGEKWNKESATTILQSHGPHVLGSSPVTIPLFPVQPFGPPTCPNGQCPLNR